MAAPRGYITRLLIVDTETSGLAYSCDDPSYNPKTGETYQIVSIGLIVVNAITLEPIEKVYLEIKWDGKSTWDQRAQEVHGLTKAYLNENGVDTYEAVEVIGNLILDHWGPDSPVHICGHNPHFDLSFFKRLLRSEGIEIKFGNKMIDTNSIGFAVFNTHNSDDLFETVGMPVRKDHNSLEDAMSVLKVLKITRTLADECFGG